MGTQKKGFTLIELLIVVAIIGVLAGIVVVSVGGSGEDASDSVKKANMRSVGTIYAQMIVTEAKQGEFSGRGNFCGGDIDGISGNNNHEIEIQIRNVLQTIVGTRAGIRDNDFASGGSAGVQAGVAHYLSGTGGLSSGNSRTVPDAGCASTNTAWVVWSNLEGGGFWCTDSQGFVGKKASKKSLGNNKLKKNHVSCQEILQ